MDLETRPVPPERGKKQGLLSLPCCPTPVPQPSVGSPWAQSCWHCMSKYPCPGEGVGLVSDVAASADTGLNKEEAGRELQRPLFPLAWGHGRLPARGFPGWSPTSARLSGTAAGAAEKKTPEAQTCDSGVFGLLKPSQNCFVCSHLGYLGASTFQPPCVYVLSHIQLFVTPWSVAC